MLSIPIIRGSKDSLSRFRMSLLNPSSLLLSSGKFKYRIEAYTFDLNSG